MQWMGNKFGGEAREGGRKKKKRYSIPLSPIFSLKKSFFIVFFLNPLLLILLHPSFFFSSCYQPVVEYINRIPRSKETSPNQFIRSCLSRPARAVLPCPALP